MLYTIAVVLVILWLLGLVTSYTIGGFIHILLVVAVIMILVRLISDYPEAVELFTLMRRETDLEQVGRLLGMPSRREQSVALQD